MGWRLGGGLYRRPAGCLADHRVEISIDILPAVLSLGPMDFARMRQYEWPANRAQK